MSVNDDPGNQCKVTLRDHLAAHALAGLIAKYGNHPPYAANTDPDADYNYELATCAYEIADNMLLVRQEREDARLVAAGYRPAPAKTAARKPQV